MFTDIGVRVVVWVRAVLYSKTRECWLYSEVSPNDFLDILCVKAIMFYAFGFQEDRFDSPLSLFDSIKFYDAQVKVCKFDTIIELQFIYSLTFDIHSTLLC